MSSSTIEGSESVVVSPKFSNSLFAIFLKILLIIFPDLVLGKSLVNCITSGLAIFPIILETSSIISLLIIFLSLSLSFKIT